MKPLPALGFSLAFGTDEQTVTSVFRLASSMSGVAQVAMDWWCLVKQGAVSGHSGGKVSR